MDRRPQIGLFGRSKSSKNAGDFPAEGDPHDNQVAHTLTACCRCRHRKTRCDPGLPRCGPCTKTNAVCDYYDAAKGRKMSREYVLYLQKKVRELEEELAAPPSVAPNPPFTKEHLVRDASFVKIKENDDAARFLGPSSGIAMTRLVMEIAKTICEAQSITEIVPEQKAREIRQRFAQEAPKPTSKVYPEISFVAAPTLPSLELTERLVENFYVKAQYLWPVLHEPSYRAVIHNVYSGSDDPYENFSLRMVIAISMQKLDTMYAGLADSYYLAALPFLEKALSARTLGSLQCLALIGIYSTVTPTRTAAYWVVGLATKMCQELGLTDEATIERDRAGKSFDTIEADLRRRLFWTCLSMELGLAHMLGRPSSFATTHDHIDVAKFLLVDDAYIRPEGVVPGTPISTKKLIAAHFIGMRLLQLEIRRTLYLRKRPFPMNDSHPWFRQMESKIQHWMANCPSSNEESGYNNFWFKAKYYGMIVFLFRPSPQIPEPSVRAARRCFEASKFVICVSRKQISAQSVDLTWIFVQTIFMATNTMLWTLSYPEVRKRYLKSEVDRYLEFALEAIYLSSVKWPGVESALELYISLVEACRKAYDGDADAAYGFGSSGLREDSTSPASVSVASELSSPSTINSALVAELPESSPASSSCVPAASNRNEVIPGCERGLRSAAADGPQSQDSVPDMDGDIVRSSATAADAASDAQLFSLNAYTHPLPAPLVYGTSFNATESWTDQNLFNAAFDEPYMRLLNSDFCSLGTVDGLDLATQSELMNNLESDILPPTVGETVQEQVSHPTKYATK